MKRDLEYLARYFGGEWVIAGFVFLTVPAICVALIQSGMDAVIALMIFLPLEVWIVRTVVGRARMEDDDYRD